MNSSSEEQGERIPGRLFGLVYRRAIDARRRQDAAIRGGGLVSSIEQIHENIPDLPKDCRESQNRLSIVKRLIKELRLSKRERIVARVILECASGKLRNSDIAVELSNEERCHFLRKRSKNSQIDPNVAIVRRILKSKASFLRKLRDAGDFLSGI